ARGDQAARARRHHADHRRDQSGDVAVLGAGQPAVAVRRHQARRRTDHAARASPRQGPTGGTSAVVCACGCSSLSIGLQSGSLRMPRFQHGSVEIAFLDEGEGEPIVLVHGFGSTKEVNWVHPGWVTTLTRAGRRVIALDNRGHGQSAKLYDPAEYHTDKM